MIVNTMDSDCNPRWFFRPANKKTDAESGACQRERRGAAGRGGERWGEAGSGGERRGAGPGRGGDVHKLTLNHRPNRQARTWKEKDKNTDKKSKVVFIVYSIVNTFSILPSSYT